MKKNTSCVPIRPLYISRLKALAGKLTSGMANGRTDWQGESSIPPSNSLCGGIKRIQAAIGTLYTCKQTSSTMYSTYDWNLWRGNEHMWNIQNIKRDVWQHLVESGKNCSNSQNHKSDIKRWIPVGYLDQYMTPNDKLHPKWVPPPP